MFRMAPYHVQLPVSKVKGLLYLFIHGSVDVKTANKCSDIINIFMEWKSHQICFDFVFLWQGKVMDLYPKTYVFVV